MSLKPIAIIMGSQSDWATMEHAAQTLDALEIGYETLIVSAHRTPIGSMNSQKMPKTRGSRSLLQVRAVPRICRE